MRITFDNLNRPKAVAKSLKQMLPFFGVAASLTRCQNITAGLYGYRDWHDIANSGVSGSRSVDDEDLSHDERDRRRTYQVAHLTDGGTPDGAARYLVRTLRPTSGAPEKFDKIGEIYQRFGELAGLLGAEGYRFHVNGDMHGVVSYYVPKIALGEKKWLRSPLRLQNLADEAIRLDPSPTFAGGSAIWRNAGTWVLGDEPPGR